MKRIINNTSERNRANDPESTGFAERFAQVAAEFGSRYALAKASGIPVTTLQNYATGSRPGIDTLATLARVANVDATWLLTGRGQMRGDGQQSGALLADVLMVDQHDPSASLVHPTTLNQIPFSRHYLERTLGISEPTWQSLLAMASPVDLLDITYGDLLLIDRRQAQLARDGVYLLSLPGFTLRGIFNRPENLISVIEPRLNRAADSTPAHGGPLDDASIAYQIDRRELLRERPRGSSKVVGRVVWVGRGR
jgi:hypothetical protein